MADRVTVGIVTADIVTADRVAADRVTANRVTADRVAAYIVTADRVTADRVTAYILTADRVTVWPIYLRLRCTCVETSPCYCRQLCGCTTSCSERRLSPVCVQVAVQFPTWADIREQSLGEVHAAMQAPECQRKPGAVEFEVRPGATLHGAA